MFVGHYGVSFAAKAADPSLPLPALMISTQLLDVAWSTFVLAGIEKVRLKRHFTATNDLDLFYMPYSHGLISAAAWSILAGLAALILLRGHSLLAAAIMAGVCFSHWLLDLLVHVRDLPLIGDRFKVGFGLWNYRNFALALELGILFAGADAYMASISASSAGLWWFTLALTAALGALQIFTVFGPSPKSIKAFAATALVAYAVIPAIVLVGEVLLASS
jgi:hypothetical protein